VSLRGNRTTDVVEEVVSPGAGSKSGRCGYQPRVPSLWASLPEGFLQLAGVDRFEAQKGTGNDHGVGPAGFNRGVANILREGFSYPLCVRLSRPEGGVFRQ